MNQKVKQAFITILGAAAGGAAGCLIFLWLARQGAVGFAIPGVAASLGATIGRCPSLGVAAVSGIIGLSAGLFAAWKVIPSGARSFAEFVTHAHQLPTLPLVLIALGGLIAFWFPFRRMQRARRAAAPGD